MADPFLSEIRLFSFNFAPQGWATCDGQTLQINQNNALYSLISTYYGGDGKTTFNLPDLRGRTPMHWISSNSAYKLGAKGGSETVTLTTDTIPAHTHSLEATTSVAASNTPASNVLAVLPADKPEYRPASDANKTLNAGAVAVAGGSAAHNNMQPSLVINFCIALTGIYPPRS